nr:MAG TPA: hypothetical protein [Caudoviricetes sp.]
MVFTGTCERKAARICSVAGRPFSYPERGYSAGFFCGGHPGAARFQKCLRARRPRRAGRRERMPETLARDRARCSRSGNR